MIETVLTLQQARQIFDAAFPLHDGPSTLENTTINQQNSSLRFLLDDKWAGITNTFNLQPIDLIRNYFGEEIALYFAFTGYYNFWLVPFSLLGILVSIYGLKSIDTSKYIEDFCTIEKTMCPQCDKVCSYWSYNETCSSNRMNHVFENSASIVYALVMTLWAASFLEFWKRKNSR